MTKTSHTPGPWEQKNGNVYGSDGFRVCQSAFGRTPQESIANDSLIAAAPDMKEALISSRYALHRAMDKISTLTGGRYDDYTATLMHWFGKQLDLMDAAIDKAEGQ